MTDESREQWGGVAASWEKDAPRVGEAAGRRAEAWQLGHARLSPGDHVLEVACGTGRTGIQAARVVLPAGRALLSDFAEPMVEAARRRADAAGVEGVDFAVLDGQDLDLPDDSFDVVICGFGLMLMPEPVKAAAEIRRVLKPDGRLVVAVWGEEEKNPWLALAFRAVMTELGAPEPAADAPTPFRLGDPEALRGVLNEAGFEDVQVEQVAVDEPHDSFETWWSRVETSAGPLVAMLAAMPEDTRAAVRARAQEGARQYETEGGALGFPATLNGAVVPPVDTPPQISDRQ